MDHLLSKSSPSLDGFAKPLRKASSASTQSLLVSRPIATNSRIKQDEKLRHNMYLAFVNNALQQKALGNSDAFDELVDQFSLEKPASDSLSPIPQLRLWIQALMHVVSRLDRSHSALIEAIVRMPWMTMETSFVKSYTSFIGVLVSARPEYLSLVLGKVAQGFTYQSGLQALDAGFPESSSAPLTRRMVYDRLHHLLRHILSLVPTLPSTLQPLLARNFPHKRQNQASQITYIRNMLSITDYCPEIADKLLSTIVDRAIQIDVEIQVELEELEVGEGAQEQSDLFELDPFDTVVGQEGGLNDSDSDDDLDGDDISELSSDGGDTDGLVDNSLDVSHIQDMVNKLDSILKLVFDHFNRNNVKATTPSLPNPSDILSNRNSPIPTPDPDPTLAEGSKTLRRTQFHTLLSIFDRTILRTFKSRYTQFLLFWYASLDAEFSDMFQGELVSKALIDTDQSVVTRAAAASYIASFVSRAEFVDQDCTRSVVQLLCRFLRSQLDMYEAVASAGIIHIDGMAPQNVFYAVAQAVFLIFCFRWRDLLQEQGEDVDEFSSVPDHGPGKKWMDELAIVQRMVTSLLNPLKYCSENVVLQFARVARATGFVYVYPLIEANRRLEFTPSTPSTPYPNGARHPALLLPGDNVLCELNTFFPFDPYKLPKSRSYIEGVYREWSSVAIDDEEDEDEDEEEDEEYVGGRSTGGIDVLNATNQDQDRDAKELGASFGGMSISPAPLAGLISVVYLRIGPLRFTKSNDKRAALNFRDLRDREEQSHQLELV
ncbi:hypothetical protein EW146_g1348 [Bondarzewia mesenterica]|uniref:RNA polymerase I-specific transcription initiation factor RRN3 n=1 Tax=Bondarzewia mesenterica TaxID=1095465 RepID=A0A4S4M6E0_9AGAM|nr:hypothetical protein EW146_g1348 [Bondarzewia mesenterica]